MSDPVDIQRRKDEMQKRRSRLLTEARITELEEKMLQIELDGINIQKELDKTRDALAKLDPIQ